MPQLAQAGQIYASQLFWLAIVFALIYFGIGKAMVPRIERTIDDRAARIARDLAAAESARGTAHASDEAYRSGVDHARTEAARAMGEAQASAAASLAASLKAGDAAAGAHVDEAVARIGDARRHALAEIEGGAAEAVQLIVAKLAGVQIDRAEAEQGVRAEMAHG